MKKFIMYGAGNIGRGFIGQLFSQSGYNVGFIDINERIISELNEKKEYVVEIVSSTSSEKKTVNNVFGIDGRDQERVAEEIASADVMATAIGVNVLKFIAKPIALGLKKRFERNAQPFNIIICENLIGADQFLKNLIIEQIPEYGERIEKEIGFVEASIGRMVPVMAEEKKQGDILRVCVEPYDYLPIDDQAIKGQPILPENVYRFAPFNLFIQRKLFMHNMSHALCAYLGYLRDYIYIYESIADFDIKYVVYKALTQSSAAISKENGVQVAPLLAHAENLLYRFSNKSLGDSVERVGKDTKRKLSANDRLIGAIKLAEKHGLPCTSLCIGVAAAMLFNPIADQSSVEIYQFVKQNGVKQALLKYSDYSGAYVDLISTLYDMLNSGKQFTAIIKYCDEYEGSIMKV